MKKLLLVFTLAWALPAQVASEANSGYRTPEGRSNVARNLNGTDRDERQKPRELIESLRLRPGMVVADLGTGVGYMLPFLSRAVGPSGKVLAEDIFDDFLGKAKETIGREKLDNVSLVKGTERDPNLPENGVDLALALDSYHHWDYPEPMLAALRRALRDGGRLVIVDFYKRPNAMPNGRAMQHIRLDLDAMIKEVEANGFKLVSHSDHIPDKQYLAVFQKN